MDRKRLHDHINWSGKAELDWESFDSPLDAEITAAQLVRAEGNLHNRRTGRKLSAMPGFIELENGAWNRQWRGSRKAKVSMTADRA